MAISKPWVRTSGQLPSLHNSQQNNYWVKLLLLLESALKLNFEALELTENLNPLLTPSSINTQDRSKNYGWIYHGMHWSLSSLPHRKARIWLPWLSRHTHQNPLKSSSVSERSAYPLQNYAAFPRSPLGLRVLATNVLPPTEWEGVRSGFRKTCSGPFPGCNSVFWDWAVTCWQLDLS